MQKIQNLMLKSDLTSRSDISSSCTNAVNKTKTLKIVKDVCVCVCVFSNANPLHYYELRVPYKADRWC